MQKNILIIIPVLNEEKNIKPLIKKIFSHLKKNDKHLLFIDDNSKDKTQKEILKFQKKYKNKIYLIKREKKLGIGSAHKCGLIWGYKKKYKPLSIEINLPTLTTIITLSFQRNPVTNHKKIPTIKK